MVWEPNVAWEWALLTTWNRSSETDRRHCQVLWRGCRWLSSFRWTEEGKSDRKGQFVLIWQYVRIPGAAHGRFWSLCWVHTIWSTTVALQNLPALGSGWTCQSGNDWIHSSAHSSSSLRLLMSFAVWGRDISLPQRHPAPLQRACAVS